jgi:hypothetical protein
MLKRRKSESKNQIYDYPNFISSSRKSNYLKPQKMRNAQSKKMDFAPCIKNHSSKMKIALKDILNRHKQNQNKNPADVRLYKSQTPQQINQMGVFEEAEELTPFKDIYRQHKNEFLQQDNAYLNGTLKKRKNILKKNKQKNLLNFSFEDIREHQLRKIKNQQINKKITVSSKINSESVFKFLNKYLKTVEDIKQNFKFVKELGRGSYATVYKVIDRLTNKSMVLKVLSIKNIKKNCHIERIMVKIFFYLLLSCMFKF